MGISITIATYNRADDLQIVLESLSRMDLDGTGPFEVIVIDNNSSDRTAELVQGFTALGSRLRYVQEPQQGLNHARNRAIAESRYEVVAFLDDDVDVDPRWLRAMEAAYASGDWAVVGGSAYLIYPAQRPRWLADRSEGTLSKVDHGPLAKEVGSEDLYGLNLTIRKDWLDRVGPFHAHLGRKGSRPTGCEETELLGRIAAGGGRFYYVPEARVGHRIAARRLERKYFWRVAYWLNRSTAEFVAAETVTVREIVRLAYHSGRDLLAAGVACLTTGPGSEPTFFTVRRLCGRWGLTVGLFLRRFC